MPAPYAVNGSRNKGIRNAARISGVSSSREVVSFQLGRESDPAL